MTLPETNGSTSTDMILVGQHRRYSYKYFHIGWAYCYVRKYISYLKTSYILYKYYINIVSAWPALLPVTAKVKLDFRGTGETKKWASAACEAEPASWTNDEKPSR